MKEWMVSMAIVSAVLAFGAPAPFTKEDARWTQLEIRVKSSQDGTWQPGYLYVPPAIPAGTRVPLLVALHSWSFGYTCHDPATWALNECLKRGWAMYYPHFRGPNATPSACGSDLAVADIADGVAHACAQAPIDAARIYLLGGSGGGHMALLMAARRPDIWAGVVAACPISDVARWHDETAAMTNGNVRYAKMLRAVCGGTPAERAEDYRHRSPVTWLAAARNVPIQIHEGIHDGHRGCSVPCGHAVRAFNELASPAERVDAETIRVMEETETVPAALRFTGVDSFYPAPRREIYLRRTSGNAQLTIFNAGHSGNYGAGIWWLARQRRGRAVDWSLPETSSAVDVHEVTR